MVNQFKRIEEFFTDGPYGKGEALNYNFNQFKDGMINTFSNLYRLNLKNEPNSLTASGQIAISGTCILSSSSNGGYSSHEIKKMLELTYEALSLHTINEVRLKDSELVLLDCEGVDSSNLMYRLLSSRFEENMRESGVSIQLLASCIDDKVKEKFHLAMRLLSETIPELSSDTLSMITAILPVTKTIDSGFTFTTPQLIYVDPELFNSELDLADALLHEALHHKLLTIRLTKRMLRPGYNDFGSFSVPIPWGGENYRMFPVGRAIAAAHVYLHLSFLFAKILFNSDKYIKFGLTLGDIEQRFLTRYKRASYLLETLSMSHYRHELGADGIDFITWMNNGFRFISDLPNVHEIISSNKVLNYI
ncbi:hypothetical protein [Paenibacillus sp. AN1007]|uniref:HEXXH motif domain-containing protein n=1 Tax=Paenibacillus sp. AN1007 TaxID=3151385 RepID=A0AAU8ND95_9BACL